MVELNSPTVFGFEITTWFVVFFISIICAAVFLVLLCIGIFNKTSKEANMIIKATYNVAKIPVKKISTPNLNSAVMSTNTGNGEIPLGVAEMYKTEEADPTPVQENSLFVTQPADEIDQMKEGAQKNNFCIYCGKPTDGKFCIYCGKEIK